MLIYLCFIAFVFSNPNNSGKQQAITSKTSQLLNGNSAVELYSSKNNSGISDEQLLLPGACDFCDGNNNELCLFYF